MSLFDYFKKKQEAKLQAARKPAFSALHTEKGEYMAFQDKLKGHSLILLILGRRGSGKTALGMKLLEFLSRQKRKTYCIGFSKAKLPLRIKKAESIEDIPNGAAVLIDEGAVLFSARDAMKKDNKAIGKLLAIARHKDLSLILITQNSAMIDLNVLRLSDTLLIKEPSMLQSRFERKALKDFYDKAVPHFAEKGEAGKKPLVYVFDDDFEGLLNFSLPEFWNESVSKSFR